jgi:arginyl-tRNA synthetase
LEKRVLETIKKYISRDNIVLDKPKKKEFGHFATPVAFALAKELKKSPIVIAQELSSELVEEEIFENVEPINGFINFKLNETFLDEYASWGLQNRDLFASNSLNDETILLEYVSANPTGPLHIGHARGAVVGDSLARIGRHLGYKITTEYYINDAGNQINLLGLSLYLAGREELGLEVEYPEQFYRGEYIKDLALDAKEQFSEEIFRDENNIEKLSLFGKDKMLLLIKENLNEVGIEFDSFVSEKELYSRLEATLADLKSGLYIKDGKTWLKSTEFGDEKDRVVVRESGEPTYLAGDIIYHNEKFKREFDRYINIWGADHHGYIARVKASLRFLGYDDNRLEILLSQMVALLKDGQPYKMSKRAGNFILMSDVVKEIGADSLRFVFLSKKCDTHLEFDVEEIKKQDSSNPLFYINYANSRIHSIFRKTEISNIEYISLKGLDEDAKDILFEALKLSQVLNSTFESRQVNRLTDYLYELASKFHKFYNETKIIGSENEGKLLKVLATVSLSLTKGLELIGIEAKTKM